MKSFTYRGYVVSATQNNAYALNHWVITIDERASISSHLEYNLDLEQSIEYNWWRKLIHNFLIFWLDASDTLWEFRCFEEALQDALQQIDRWHTIRSKELDHERLMEARLTLAAELLP